MKRRVLALMMSLAVALAGINVPVMAEEELVGFEDLATELLSEEVVLEDSIAPEEELDVDLTEEEPVEIQVEEEAPEFEESVSEEIRVPEDESTEELFANEETAVSENELFEDDLFAEEAETLEAGMYPESAHPYETNEDESWTYSIPGAYGLKIHFSVDTAVEKGDFIYIYQGSDATGKLIGKYTGAELSGKTIIVPGESVCIRFISDGFSYGYKEYGFAVDQISALTEEEEQSDFRYDTLSDGTIEIRVYVGTATDVVIPDTILGKPVTSIGDWVFYDRSDLTSVKIPDSVKSIGNKTFYGCSKLTSIKIPGSVKSIGNDAFGGCSGLTSVVIPDSVKSIGNDAFRGCSGLTGVVIPDSVTDLEGSVFQNCSGLTSVKLPKGITVISDYIFAGCTELTSIELPDGVTRIGWHAFLGCSGLTSVVIPDSVVYIGVYAFKGCSRLTSIKIPKSMKCIEWGAFKGCSSLTSVEISNGVTEIDESAFENCRSLTSIVLPNSVKKIGEKSFAGCRNLTSVLIPKSVTSIWNCSFDECRKLTIKGYKGTYAEKYAGGLGIKFVSLNPILSKTTSISKLTNTAAGVKISWNKVAGAKGYYVYRKKGNDSFVKIATIKSGTTVTYEDKSKLANGAKYSYRVRAYNGSEKSNYTGLSIIRLGRPAISNCSNTAKGQITVNWNRNRKATGYQVKYVLGSKTKTITIKKNATISSVIQNLTKGQTYKVSVRNYVTSNAKTYYSAWSEAKSVKITK